MQTLQPDINAINAAPPPPAPDDTAGTPVYCPPAPLSTEAAVERYEYLLGRAAELANAENGEVNPEIGQEIEALESYLVERMDACGVVLERREAAAAAYEGQVQYYEGIVMTYRKKQDSEEAVVARLKDKIRALCELQPDERFAGERFRARLQKGTWTAVPVEPGAPVPKEAEKITISTDRKVLLALAREGKAPGWEAKQTKSLRIERV